MAVLLYVYFERWKGDARRYTASCDHQKNSPNVSQMWDPGWRKEIDVCAGIINSQHKISVLFPYSRHL